MDNEGDLQESYRADYSSVELAFDLKNITLKMTSNQRDILKYLILGWSDSEIASFLHFSRQYVNREKKKIIVCDEAWLFLKYKESADFLVNVARRR